MGVVRLNIKELQKTAKKKKKLPRFLVALRSTMQLRLFIATSKEARWEFRSSYWQRKPEIIWGKPGSAHRIGSPKRLWGGKSPGVRSTPRCFRPWTMLGRLVWHAPMEGCLKACRVADGGVSSHFRKLGWIMPSHYGDITPLTLPLRCYRGEYSRPSQL